MCCVTIPYMAHNLHRTIKRALISVYDKTGVVAFARALVDEFGIEIISTGGTAALLKENGIPVTLVEHITGFPEMLDGRVKTLHPKIHAAILADRDNPEHMRQLSEQGIEPIDMVVVNLYPFQETVSDPACPFGPAIEMIDIGGPCLLRAAAKNHKHVLVVSCVDAYTEVLDALSGENRMPIHLRNGIGAFEATTRYDADVAGWLGRRKELDGYSYLEAIFARNRGRMRYGENPHQNGELLQYLEDHGSYDLTTAECPAESTQQQRMSFNNFADAHAALALCSDLSRELTGSRTSLDGLCGSCVCTFIKHTNACGVGIAADPIEAYQRAYLGDPNAAMGGILANNKTVDASFAEAVMATYARWGKQAGAGGFFVEVWIAPRFSEDAIELIRSAKAWGQRVRLLAVGDMTQPCDKQERIYKSIAGGLLAQSGDAVGLNERQWKVVTKRQPSDSEMADLRLAWLIGKHTKSNAITICKDGRLIGNGAGQMSRVMSCRIATWLAGDNGHGDQLAGSVAASDAFFPFPDGPNLLFDAGVGAVIQPGGSKRDDEVIAACDARNVAMIFTGTRHFKH